MKQEIQTIRGIRDLVDHELITYRKVIEIGEKIATLHNYSPIILPIFEYSSVFHRTLGETSDIVTKETYTFVDREKRTITLRPEFTAAMVRSMISNGWTQNLPKRFFTYGPLFRHERPQKGRYRQFYQFNCELFGSSSAYADVEIINIMMSILKDLKLEEAVDLEINSLGDPESAEKYKEVLKKYL
jgi:histidyl-tRNA synthetase